MTLNEEFAALTVLLAVVLPPTGGHGQGPVLVERKAVAGTYVMVGHGFKDELILKDDGSVSRVAVHKGGRWIQSGRWKYLTETLREGTTVTLIEFSDLTPACTVPEVGRDAVGRPFPWTIPETPLCERSKLAFLCYDHDILSICFDENATYRFHRR